MRKAKDFEIDNASDASQGEIRINREFEKIEDEIRKKRSSKQPKSSQSREHGGDGISIEKLEPYLNNMQTINNHNLAVATNYMMQLQQIQIDLQREQENAFKAIKRSEHLERKYEITTKRMQNLIDQYRQERDDAKAENSKLIYEKTIHGDILTEKDMLIKNKTNLCMQLEESLNYKEKELHLMREEDLRLQALNKKLIAENNEHILNIGSEQYQVVSLKKQLERDQNLFEDFKNNMRLEMKSKDNQYELEHKLKNSLQKEVITLQERITHEEEISSNLKQEVEKLQHAIKKLQERNLVLEEGYKVYYKEEIAGIYEKNVAKCSNLEHLLQNEQTKNADLQITISVLKTQIKQAEASRQFYIKENDDAELNVAQIQKERGQYLDQFRKLKTQYEKTIFDMEETHKNTRLEIFKTQEESKTLHMRLKEQEERIAYLLEIQEIMSLQSDGNFYRVVTDLKTRGVGNFSKEEFIQIKDLAIQEHAQAQAKREAEFREYKAKRNMEDILSTNLEQKKDEYKHGSDKFDHEWNQLMFKLENVSQKQDNQSRLQQIR